MPSLRPSGASIVNLHEFIWHNPQTEMLYFCLGVYNNIDQFHHFYMKLCLHKNPFHVWEALEMRKNHVVFGSMSGRANPGSRCLGHSSISDIFPKTTLLGLFEMFTLCAP